MDRDHITNSTQRNFWSGEFGDSYVDRNLSTDEMNRIYSERTGIPFEKVFHDFFSDLNKDLKILELGCNVGLNLQTLKNMGFKHLDGLEINHKAIDVAKRNNPEINFIHSSIEDFQPNEKFDLVYTAGVLIHINPSALNSIVRKIIELSQKYIFGFEYYSDELVEVSYRNYSKVLWKQNFPLLFKKISPSLQVIKEIKIPYKSEDLCDIAYLFKKI